MSTGFCNIVTLSYTQRQKWIIHTSDNHVNPENGKCREQFFNSKFYFHFQQICGICIFFQTFYHKLALNTNEVKGIRMDKCMTLWWNEKKKQPKTTQQLVSSVAPIKLESMAALIPMSGDFYNFYLHKSTGL